LTLSLAPEASPSATEGIDVDAECEAVPVAGQKIRVEGVTKIYGRSPEAALDLVEQGVPADEVFTRTGCVLAVHDVSFAVDVGETFVVMGLSGSGKSTLVRCLNRLVDPTSGRVFIDDEDITAFDRRHLRELRRTTVSMVFQSFALFPHKTVLENVAYPLKLRGHPRGSYREHAREALAVVGLEIWGERYPHQLSGGMQQRVGLARALATDADVLLMDEPFSALDPLLRREMQGELVRLQDNYQKTIVFISHDVDEAIKIGTRIAIMHGGRIVQLGTPAEIVLSPRDAHVAEFVRDIDPARVLTAGAVARDDRDRLAHTFALDADGRPVRVLGAGSADFRVVSESMPLLDTLALFSESTPIAVVDERGAYVGSLSADALVAGLARHRDRDTADRSARIDVPDDKGRL
jgi:glycine betaine/proline transport system ATP-binding protein